MSKNSVDTFKVRGRVELIFFRGGVEYDRIIKENIILDQGKEEVANSLAFGSNRTVVRMAIGDRGTLPSDPTVPKIPPATATSLYHEVHRQDLQSASVQFVDGKWQCLFTANFKALEIPPTAYASLLDPVINEVGLVMADLVTGAPLPRPPISSPDPHDVDEIVFSLRTFKSVPFEAANETSVLIKYTITIG